MHTTIYVYLLFYHNTFEKLDITKGKGSSSLSNGVLGGSTVGEEGILVNLLVCSLLKVFNSVP